MGPAELIAIDVTLLYLLLGPLVLFAVYVLFDFISFDTPAGRTDPGKKTDPALWTSREIDDFLDRS
jgi:hypothetical protein